MPRIAQLEEERAMLLSKLASMSQEFNDFLGVVLAEKGSAERNHRWLPSTNFGAAS
eukprot:m.816156 g.816156  ORF g.816156 m.816156 type:complete len:56 (+) comp59382_c0_seq3:236-403(+)